MTAVRWKELGNYLLDNELGIRSMPRQGKKAEFRGPYC
jgi:hypothetical protein